MCANATKNALVELFKKTMSEGDIVTPRGEEVRELRNTIITIDPHFPFQAWDRRKYSFKYFQKEAQWFLSGNKYDDSILEYAKMWAFVQNPDKTFNSNYGQYWFGEQQGLMKAVFQLLKDRDTRKAVIPMLNDSHTSPYTIDTVCTESITFHIRKQRLYMSVHMRSSDQIFGLGSDLPMFAMLQHIAVGLLRSKYSGLCAGDLTVVAASSHIYERHYEMIEDIIKDPDYDFKEILLNSAAGPAEALNILGQVEEGGFSLTRAIFDPQYFGVLS